jgi:hypothetical protein
VRGGDDALHPSMAGRKRHEGEEVLEVRELRRHHGGELMSNYHFYVIQELRCPHCKSKLDYEQFEQFGSKRIVAVHPKSRGGKKCPRQGKRFYAPGVDLTEFIP